MRTINRLLLISMLLHLFDASPRAQETAAEATVKIAYFYTVKWGHQDEFVDLYGRNHYPVLEAQQESGRIVGIETYVPRFHGDGRSDWTFMVVLTFRDWQALADNSQEQEIIRRLFPDQEKFRKEEQRRFEILEAHWDVPLRPSPME
ncbi:MAG: hypothetical protein ACRD1R_04645 [Acidobacteriota bacterium]